MESILYTLYKDNYDITPKRNEEQQEIYDKLFVELDKVQSAFGLEFIDRVLSLKGELEDQRAFHYYREGFRLGVRLMLEALTSAMA